MWDMLESHERVPPQAPKWISQKIQDWLIQDWPRLSLLGNFYWKYAVCASLKVSNRFFHNPYLHSSFFGQSRQQEQDTLPPANSGWEYQAPTEIQTWFNLFFLCCSSVFRCIFKGLELPLERERETEKQSLVEFRFGSRKTQTKNLEWPTISNLHFQQWRWTWNLPCFSFIFCPLPPLRWTVEPTLESANSKMELWGPSGTPGTLQLNKSPKVGLGDLINHFFPGGNMEKAAGFWWEFTEWFQNIRQNDSLNTKTELKLSKYEIKG